MPAPVRPGIRWHINDAAVKSAVERFIKQMSFSAHREVEKAVRYTVAGGKLKAGEATTVSVTLSIKNVDLDVTIFSKIEI